MIEGSVLKAPLNTSEPYYLMGVGTYNGGFCETYICSNLHGKINRYAYYKPIRGYSMVDHIPDDNDYYDSLTVLKYKIGGALPSDFKYPYNNVRIGIDFSRITDFINYNHNEQISSVNISAIPDVLDYDYYNTQFRISEGYSSKPLLQILINGRAGSGNYVLWRNAILIIAENGSIKKYFMLTSARWEAYSMPAFISNRKEVYDLLRSINIQNYTCKAIAVIIPDSHPDKNANFHEISELSNYEYIIYPEANNDIPFKNNFKITRPRDRSFWNVSIRESESTQQNYIPELAVIGGNFTAMKPNGAGDDLWYEPNGITFAEWKKRSGDLFGGIIDEGSIIVEDVYTSFKGALFIQYFNFGNEQYPNYVKPIITSFTSGGRVVDNPSNKTISIIFDNLPIQAELNYMHAEFYFSDPNYRPELN